MWKPRASTAVAPAHLPNLKTSQSCYGPDLQDFLFPERPEHSPTPGPWLTAVPLPGVPFSLCPSVPHHISLSVETLLVFENMNATISFEKSSSSHGSNDPLSVPLPTALRTVWCQSRRVTGTIFTSVSQSILTVTHGKKSTLCYDPAHTRMHKTHKHTCTCIYTVIHIHTQLRMSRYTCTRTCKPTQIQNTHLYTLPTTDTRFFLRSCLCNKWCSHRSAPFF